MISILLFQAVFSASLLNLNASAKDMKQANFKFSAANENNAIADSFYLNLAFHHAPIHFQDVDDDKPKSDYIAAMNYDNNWRSDDNWNNVNKHPLKAHVYYSVTETKTHWFIIYSFFHPQDWDDDFEQEHENDIEGQLSIVRKTTDFYGKLEAMITVFHTDFYSYYRIGSGYENGAENIDGYISYQKDPNGFFRPVTCQEAKGHGLKAFPYAGNFKGNPGEDGIIYYPSKTTAEVPTSRFDRNVKYKLVSLTGTGSYWARQLTEASLSTNECITFNSWGNMKGNSDGGCGDGITVTCSDNSANAPWNWDDSDDGTIHRGMLGLDPAAVAKRYFTIPGEFSLTYTKNVYLKNLRDAGYSNQNKPRGWPAALDLSKLLEKLE